MIVVQKSHFEKKKLDLHKNIIKHIEELSLNWNY